MSGMRLYHRQGTAALSTCVLYHSILFFLAFFGSWVPLWKTHPPTQRRDLRSAYWVMTYVLFAGWSVCGVASSFLPLFYCSGSDPILKKYIIYFAKQMNLTMLAVWQRRLSPAVVWSECKQENRSVCFLSSSSPTSSCICVTTQLQSSFAEEKKK